MYLKTKILIVFAFCLCSVVDAGINDYKFRYLTPDYSSYGTTGILQMPSARMKESGTVSAVFSDFDPYQRVAIIAYPFDWLEAIYQYTDISNTLYSPVFAFSGNQTYKDKGFDLKIRIIKESNLLPEVSMGIRDLGGTGLFSGEYIAASKFLNGFDITIGAGWGVLGDNRFSNPLTKVSDRFRERGTFSGKGGEFNFDSFFSGNEIGFFGGIEYTIPFFRGVKIKAEYDSMNYSAEGFDDPHQKSKFNYGLSIPISRDFKLGLGYVRGNTLQFTFAMSLNLGKQQTFFSKKADQYQNVQNSEILKRVTARENRFLYRSLLRDLNDRDIYIRSANLDESSKELAITFSQNKFLSYPRSYGRIFRLMDQVSPNDVTSFKATSQNIGLILSTVKVDRNQFNTHKNTNDFVSLNEFTEIYQIDRDQLKEYEFQPPTIYPKTFFEIGPSFQTHIGGPDRFLIGGINFGFDTETLLTKNINLQTRSRFGIVDTFDALEQPSDSILPHVRSDIIDYLKEGKNFSISRFQMNYFKQLSNNQYFKLSGGILEEMFGGLGFEYLYRPFNSNLAIGIDAFEVRQRDFDQRFSFREYQTKTGHITFYYNEPRSRILFKLIGGKFLAGDSGITFDASRRFKSGAQIGAFFTITDISEEEFGEGSFDKGFYINFPLEAFSRKYSRDLSGFTLRPLTRDGGAKLIVGHELYGITDQGSFNNIFRDFEDIYD